MYVLLQVNMDEDEIDSWYEEEKQKYIDEYLQQIEQTKNHEEAEKSYNEKLNRVIAKYNKLMEEKIRNKEKKGLSTIVFKIKKAVFSFKGK